MQSPTAIPFDQLRAEIRGTVIAPAGRQSWVDDLAEALRQTDGRAYVNFLGSDGAERIRAAYPGTTWDRLTEIKRRYDPANLFRLNQNIVQASDG